jgi:hypothetical protein
MRAIRVTVDRRDDGVGVSVAMSPSVLEELVQNGGMASFDSSMDKDVVLDLDVEVGVLDPENPNDEFVRMEFERDVEEYEAVSDAD